MNEAQILQQNILVLDKGYNVYILLNLFFKSSRSSFNQL